jgi:hypothetical protein
MRESNTAELSLVESIPTPAPLATPAPAFDPHPLQTRPAFKRCTAAWQRTFKAGMEGTDLNEIAAVFAAHDAGEAYCKAMPLLSGYENIRDYIACAAHGMLIGAIRPYRSSQVLYAAQLALATFNCEPKSRKSA